MEARTGLQQQGLAHSPLSGVSRRVGAAVLTAECLASMLLVVLLGQRLAFFHDDWRFLLMRPGWNADALLTSNNGHLSVLDVVFFKALTWVFGLEHQLPFRVALGGALASLGVVIYAWVAERTSRIAGLAAAGLILFFGPAWEDLLFVSSISLIGALSAGLWALWVLRLPGRRRDVGACLLLLVAVCLSNLGLVFVGGALVRVAIDRRWRSIGVGVVPLLVFAAWWLTYGRDSPSGVSAHNVAHLPVYVAKAAAIGAASTVGALRGSVDRSYLIGALVVTGAIAAVIYRAARHHPPPARVLVPAAALVGFWSLAGAGQTPGRAAEASRYQLLSAAIGLIVAAELARGIRVSRGAAAVLGLVWLLAVASNFDLYRSGYGFMLNEAQTTKIALGALSLTGGDVDPAFTLDPTVARNPYLGGVVAGAWFAETSKHGRPAVATIGQIRSASPERRRIADSILAGAARPSVVELAVGSGCKGSSAPLLANGRDEVIAGAGVEVANRGSAGLFVGIRRFASVGQSVPIGVANAGRVSRVEVAPSASGLPPWRVSVYGSSRAVACVR